MRNVIFIPGYYDGRAPHGIWYAKNLSVFSSWSRFSYYERDLGFFSVYDRGKMKLVDMVGGNGFAYNFSSKQSNVRVFGWPAEGRYNGRYPYYCEGNTWNLRYSSSDMAISCDMTGGASGGPWVLARGRSENLGYVFGVTSRRTTNGPPLLISTPFDRHSYLLMLGAQ